MILEKGSNSNPTGNLIVYCKVIGENPFQDGYEIIASNVIVSFLKIKDSLPVVTFPPIPFPNLEELQNSIARNNDLYDIVRLPDFIMPEGKDQTDRYIQSRMEQFNSFVLQYMELCKKREASASEVKEETPSGYLNALLQISAEFRSSSGLAKEIARKKVDSVMTEIANKYPQFDTANYRNALFKFPGIKGDELTSLYLKKFFAIQAEEYETASLLKQRILEMETN
ncbi:MAG: hypothetical protein SFU98_09275 [Leptospiraceae bacterium]|nr:hypothetical protein [Leptospiraceae bacterium]